MWLLNCMIIQLEILHKSDLLDEILRQIGRDLARL